MFKALQSQRYVPLRNAVTMSVLIFIVIPTLVRLLMSFLLRTLIINSNAALSLFLGCINFAVIVLIVLMGNVLWGKTDTPPIKDMASSCLAQILLLFLFAGIYSRFYWGSRVNAIFLGDGWMQYGFYALVTPVWTTALQGFSLFAKRKITQSSGGKLQSLLRNDFSLLRILSYIIRSVLCGLSTTMALFVFLVPPLNKWREHIITANGFTPGYLDLCTMCINAAVAILIAVLFFCLFSRVPLVFLLVSFGVQVALLTLFPDYFSSRYWGSSAAEFCSPEFFRLVYRDDVEFATIGTTVVQFLTILPFRTIWKRKTAESNTSASLQQDTAS